MLGWLKANVTYEKVVAVILLLVGAFLLSRGASLAAKDGMAAAATATYTAGLSVLVFAFLSRFKKFKGLGVEAEMWEQKMEEAEKLVNQLRGLATTLSRPMLLMAARAGRWDAAMRRDERQALLTEITKTLTDIGLATEERDTVVAPLHDAVVHDLTRDAYGDLNRWVSNYVNEHVMPKVASEDETERRAVRERADGTNAIWVSLGDVPAHQRREDIVRRIRAAVQDNGFLPADEKKRLLAHIEDRLIDIEHYVAKKQHRRPEVWLTTRA